MTSTTKGYSSRDGSGTDPFNGINDDVRRRSMDIENFVSIYRNAG